MALPVYPVDDFDQGSQLLQQLGSFWVNVFQEADTLQAHLRSSGHVHGQNHLKYLEAVACLSRLTVPVFSTQNWFLMTALKSEAEKLSPLYGDAGLNFNETQNGNPVEYGEQNSPLTLVPMPSQMADAKFVLQNMVLYPSKVWVAGVDYRMNPVRHALEFNVNPFTDPMVPRRDIVDKNGTVIDSEIAFWVYRGEYDLGYIYTHFGYVLNLKLKSSQGYKDILNAVWDMYVSGFCRNNLSAFLAAMSGTPTAVGPAETVELIRTERDSQIVVTNVRVYRVPLTATVTVAVGDTVVSGQSLCDAVLVSEFGGSNPDYSILPAISLSKSFLSGNYFGEITFKNHDVALEYLGQQSGKAVVRFETGGFPADVETFWDFVHSQGVSTGKTIANLLDTRKNPSNEPMPMNLPAMINPLEFVLRNLLGNNLFAIRVRQSSFDPRAPGLDFFRLLRATVPPHTTYVVFVELTPPVDVLDLSMVGDEDNAGAEETIGRFLGNVAQTDNGWVVGAGPDGDFSYEDASVTARLISTTCQ